MRFQAWHIIVLVIAFILLFGWKNLPKAARSLGESMRVFKTEVDQMKSDKKDDGDEDTAQGPSGTSSQAERQDTIEGQAERPSVEPDQIQPGHEAGDQRDGR